MTSKKIFFKVSKFFLSSSIVIAINSIAPDSNLSFTLFESARATGSSTDPDALIKYEESWDGNHPKAMSESWTWMGHLKEIEDTDGDLKFTNNGVAFIHYYTRNKSKMGSLTFKSSALTPTVNNIGQDYLKQTLYSSLTKDFYLKTNQNKLGLEWRYKGRTDSVKAASFNPEFDLAELDHKLLKLFPNLKKDSTMTPIKSILNVNVGNDSHFNLTLYSIWQPLAPTADGRIRFLGVDGTFTFFHPMIIAIGQWTQKGVTKKVCGMLTLDRQWSNEYFGKSLFDKTTDFFKAYRALSYAHNWSGFHGYLPESKSWVFVHLWNQFYRKDNEPDVPVPYSNMVWVKNGLIQSPLSSSEYNWLGENFALNESKVLLNFGEGREGYFPTQFKLTSQVQNLELTLKASPVMQSLEQPIYLYEGFAIGDGTWQGEPIRVQGRIESSRLLFRDQDYDEMIQIISNSTEQDVKQQLLKEHLEDLLREDKNCPTIFCPSQFKKEQKKKEDYYKFVSNDMNLKLSILKGKFTHKESEIDPNDPSTVIYY
jgi:hypothetical protein